MQPQTRQQMIQKIHIAKNELKMDKNAYVQFLLDTVDKHSCTVMSDAELMQVLQAMQAKGFRVKTKHGKRPTASQFNPNRQRIMRKIEAFLADNNKHWNYAHAICKRAFGIDRLQWCTDDQLHSVMKMLAVDAYRHGRRVK